MKIKTSDLSGIALDWAVAKCEGFTPTYTCPYNTMTLWKNEYRYIPSSDWSQGGPIIERERISIGLSANGAQWVAHISNAPESKKHWTHGPTPLIAAMRCYVSSRLGDTVEVPNELA